jgi:hypothetical protein
MSTLCDPRPAAQQEREAALVHLLQRIWTYSITTKSDDARNFADEVAEAASRQLITSAIVPGSDAALFGRLWKLTPAGTQLLFDNGHLLIAEEVAYARSYCA